MTEALYAEWVADTADMESGFKQWLSKRLLKAEAERDALRDRAEAATAEASAIGNECADLWTRVKAAEGALRELYANRPPNHDPFVAFWPPRPDGFRATPPDRIAIVEGFRYSVHDTDAFPHLTAWLTAYLTALTAQQEPTP